MTKKMDEIAALIVAAGKAAGGEPFRPTEMVGGISAIQRLIMVFKQAGIRRIAVVSGEGDRLEKHVSHMGVVCLQCGEGGAQMLDCVKAGLVYLKGKCGGALITPVDVPLFSPETVQTLAGCGEKLAVPVCGGKAGHPLLVSARLFPSILRYGGRGGLSGAVRETGEARKKIEVADEGVLFSVKRDADFEALAESHSLRRLRPEMKIRLAREEVFYGPGAHQLLELIEETGSVHLACGRMGLSYSKGWKLISAMEGQLGYAVVKRRQGGKDGGKSTVTARGAELMKKYAAFERECGRRVKEAFDTYFGEE